jgi:hypothetical protein
VARSSIKAVTVIIVNFDEVARYDDQRVWAHVAQTCRLSRKRLIPKSVRYNGYRVTRGKNVATVHLYFDKEETFQFAFAPAFPIQD